MDVDQFPEDPRTQRARERQRRRQERRTRSTRVPSVKFKRPQLASPGRVTLPEITGVPVRPVLGAAAGALFLVAIVVALGLFKSGDPKTPPNAIWIGTGWTYEQPSPVDIEVLTQRLRDNEIGTVYAWVSWLQADGTWRGAENFPAVQNFVKQFNEMYPEARLYAWLGLPTNLDADDYRLDDAVFQETVANFSRTVVFNYGFDGVFLNAEPVWNGDQNFLDLLRRVRTSVGEEAAISVAIPPDWSPVGAGIPVPPLIAPGTVWEQEYKQRVALLSDQMAVMAYNSGLSNPADYELWIAYQVEAFTQAVTDLDVDTELVFGIPTYNAEPPGHDPNVENVVSAVNGIRTGLLKAGENADIVQGLALYAEWETDESEWAQFRLNWVNK